MQKGPSRIWIRVADSIAYDDNGYLTTATNILEDREPGWSPINLSQYHPGATPTNSIS